MKATPKRQGAAAIQVTIAIVDDDPPAVELIADCVRDTGATVRSFTDPKALIETLALDPPDVVITDISMPDVNGLALLKLIRERRPETDVLLVTGHADKDSAIRALKLGAFDFFEKPVRRDELLAAVSRTFAYRRAVRERDRLAEQLSFVSQTEARRWGIEAFVGRSTAIKKVLSAVRMLQRVRKTSVLITGESGTGKELVARAIHFGSARSSRPFVPVNCSAVPPDLAESTFFGHVRGSFTGATSDKKGCFELADGGTLFLDEVGDMLPATQTKLLRVLEDGAVVPVGGTRPTAVDVRVIAATNTALGARITSKTFRSDLFYRLAGFELAIPPLRERVADIPLLVDHFVKSLSFEMGFANPAVSPEALQAIMGQQFPGNVRELRNLMERALIESCGDTVTKAHLHFAPVSANLVASDAGAPPSAAAMRLPLNLRVAQLTLVRRAMAEAQGNVSAAARLLGIDRNKVYRLLASSGD